MIDLNNFTDISGITRKADRPYLYVAPSIGGHVGAYLSLPASIATQLIKYFGNEVTVKRSRDIEKLQLVIIRGTARRIAHKRENLNAYQISLASIHTDVTKAFGENVRRIYLETAWENDENGNKVFLFTATGEKEYRDK